MRNTVIHNLNLADITVCLVESPNDVESIHAIALVHFEQKLYWLALKWFARLATLRVTDSGSWLNVGVASRKTGSRDIRPIQRAWVCEPSGLLEFERLLQSWQSEDDIVIFERRAIRYSTLAPASVEVRLLCSKLLASVNPRLASVHAAAALALAPDNIQALLELIRVVLNSKPSTTSIKSPDFGQNDYVDTPHLYGNQILQAFAAVPPQVNSWLNRVIVHDEYAQLEYASTLAVADLRAEALAVIERALVHAPNSTAVLTRLSSMLGSLSRSVDSLRWSRRGRSSNPRDYLSLTKLAWSLNELGLKSECLELLDTETVAKANTVELNSLAGAIALEIRRFELCNQAFRRSVALEPSRSSLYSKAAIGVLADRTATGSEAGTFIHRALLIDRCCGESHNNLGILLERRGDYRAALSCYQRAIAVNPAFSEPRLNLGVCQLGLGDFSSGWQNYECRWTANSIVLFGRENQSRPLLSSKRSFYLGARGVVLIWAEQGVGDEIMFASLLLDFAGLCDAVVVQADYRLLPIFRRSFPSITFVSRDSAPDESGYHFHLPLASVGRYVRPNLASFAKQRRGYLRSPQNIAPKLRVNDELEEKKISVGISWKSINPDNGAQRSIGLEPFLKAFFELPVRFVNLQYSHEDAIQRFRAARSGDWPFFEPGITDLDNDLDGLAAIMSECDLIVSVGNSVAHLAAAIGRPTWVLVPVAGSWRWMFSGTSTPWYPTVRIFRQQVIGEWDTVLGEVRSEFCRTFLRDGNSK